LPSVAAILTWLAVLGAFFRPAAARGASAEFLPTEYKLLSADGSRVIGQARFRIAARASGRELVQGRYRFNDGEYDVDEDWLEMQPGDRLPTLLTYKHVFFHPDGSFDRVSEADIERGRASCTIYVDRRPETQSAQLAFPPDVYAGPALILPIRHLVYSGSKKKANFHAFTCAPGPKIYAISGSIKSAVDWRLYAGKVVEVDIQPDFGPLNFIVASFLPTIRLWFDPAKDFELVGVELTLPPEGIPATS
jgi:hypothetical protein